MPALLRRTFHAAARRLRPLASEQSGFTLIEMIVTAALVAGIAGGVMAGMEASNRASADFRHRSEAEVLAQQDQERMRGESVAQLNGLNQTRYVTLEGIQYRIVSTGQFISSSTGGTSCTDQKADYVRTKSEVYWEWTNRDPSLLGSQNNPLTEQSIISPPAGGSVVVQVNDDSSNPQSDVTVRLTGSGAGYTAQTDANGCASFAGIPAEAYSVIASKPGWVEPTQSQPQAVSSVSATTADTRSVDLVYAQGGAAQAAFNAKIGALQVPGESPALSWKGGTMLGTGVAPTTATTTPSSSITTPMTLFPFHNGGSTTDNYEVWAGRCTSDEVPNSGATAPFVPKVTVDPGANGSTAQPVQLPAMLLNVTFSGLPIKPTQVKLTDACGDSWFPTIAGSGIGPGGGVLAAPGQAYGTYQAVCAVFGGRYVRLTNVQNKNFTTGTSTTISILPTSSRAPGGRCP
jgi:prepilin-type N-terminal cleavage/methylation domain-containing protein